MDSTGTLIAFVAAAVSYALVPGPGTVYLVSRVASRDLKAALYGALGLHAGGYAIVVASATGLASVFSLVPVLYEAVKLAGAAYLIFLGVRLLVRRTGDHANSTRHGDQRRPASFSQGLLVEILNPTTVVFYVAFLPQFISANSDTPVWLQFLVLGVALNVLFSLCDILTIILVRGLRNAAVHRCDLQRTLRCACGLALVGFGVRLLREQR